MRRNCRAAAAVVGVAIQRSSASRPTYASATARTSGWKTTPSPRRSAPGRPSGQLRLVATAASAASKTSAWSTALASCPGEGDVGVADQLLGVDAWTRAQHRRCPSATTRSSALDRRRAERAMNAPDDGPDAVRAECRERAFGHDQEAITLGASIQAGRPGAADEDGDRAPCGRCRRLRGRFVGVVDGGEVVDVDQQREGRKRRRRTRRAIGVVEVVVASASPATPVSASWRLWRQSSLRAGCPGHRAPLAVQQPSSQRQTPPSAGAIAFARVVHGVASVARSPAGALHVSGWTVRVPPSYCSDQPRRPPPFGFRQQRQHRQATGRESDRRPLQRPLDEPLRRGRPANSNCWRTACRFSA